ncbi:MAG: transcription antiterminator [Solobacterium sp.]|nr:transcription antiterminator [Solobacterium sp.]
MANSYTSYRVVKTISNNLVRARDVNDRDVFLTGKGIGFGKKQNDIISNEHVESVFSLETKKEQSLYEELLNTTSPALIEVANEVISYIQSQFTTPLNEHIHVALTDHIAFMVRRCKMGIPIENPFSIETASLYPRETEVAKHAVEILEEKLRLNIPSDEIGFITLHIITSLSEKTFHKIQQETALLDKLISIIESQFQISVKTDDLNYSRLVTHIRFLLERQDRNEFLTAPVEMMEHVRTYYPICYTVAYKLVKTIEQYTGSSVPDNEIFYLALHVYRFSNSLAN